MEYPLIHDCRFAVGENPYIIRACKLRGANSFLCHERFKFNSSIRQKSRPREIRVEKQARAKKWLFPSSSSNESNWNSISEACIECLRRFNFPLILVSGISSIYLFCFNLCSEAHGNQTPLFVGSAACEDVSNYYSRAEKIEGEALKKELQAIISSHHQSLSYKEVWEALKILDAADVDNPYDSSDIIEIYSLRSASKSIAGKLEGWNREHLWPRSYGLTHGPSLTDLHNIRPADVNVNSSRGNKYFGECLRNSIDCVKPANKEAASDTETDKERWAPPVQVRGDIARAIMYMAVRYGFHQVGGNPILHLSDSPSIRNREMGLLSTLLKWNRLDPPSRAEQLRNERVCRLYQHNRNPFIDHPEYADLIWNQSSMAWVNEFHCKNRGRDQTEDVIGRQKQSKGIIPKTSKIIGKHNNRCLE
ncbi:extracellular ribonuclease-like [Telopea speciosissima]|uniref:extracellular ribonuclease-like n=1 Tax=Telopea speciosissima TaxID=54955 RepID=UPI001CC456BE|nr:extracellular ribonuclease-like [Telopea speciosissima]